MVIVWNFELDIVVNCNVGEKGVVGNGELCGASVWDVQGWCWEATFGQENAYDCKLACRIVKLGKPKEQSFAPNSRRLCFFEIWNARNALSPAQEIAHQDTCPSIAFDGGNNLTISVIMVG